MNEQIADSYCDYDYKEPPVKAVSMRSIYLLMVGLLGMVAYVTYALCCLGNKFYYWYLQNTGEYLLPPETFGCCLKVCYWSARVSVLGCYVALMVSHVKWRHSLIC